MDSFALTDLMIDRARGALLAAACGDALGVPYEFAHATQDPQMVGGGLGPYRPGEWSDDTQMAICIASVADSGLRLTSDRAQDEIGQNFINWMHDGASDIGIQTRAVLSAAAKLSGDVSDRLRESARQYAMSTDRAGGNGALMRIAPVGISFLWDRDATARAARDIASLTHFDREVKESCILWAEAMRVAVVDGVLDMRVGLDLLLEESRDKWNSLIADAERGLVNPRTNGYTVSALQCAWFAVVATHEYFGEAAMYEGLRRAVKLGGDTDTVATIAGALLGARWGESAIPVEWRESVHGWPGMTGQDLADMGERIVRNSHPRGF
ncbi:ADP-ribosylglycohydrolase family protein [Trueperella pecoris]|uniref:ADP-ribosylglycohydrolase family protein n=1 Tax=Trueperella pecoris TaxID=2733571 RepID=A0A7M1QV80_9ACTO|nr:ADP-ribosylglycohydrolase family protein [Trueperella pecoris]QOQ39640.1 ADP-ribosylglycohydrolase family protein [Trueperella pecoris]QOR45733.1 ADP-ribosylglycohydrolase family protein [Trueperella pecoris]